MNASADALSASGAAIGAGFRETQASVALADATTGIGLAAPDASAPLTDALPGGAGAGAAPAGPSPRIVPPPTQPDAPAAAQASGNANLSDLTVQPALAYGDFDANTTEYSFVALNATTTAIVYAAAASANASVQFTDGSDAAITDGNGARPGHQVALSAGSNTVKVVVTRGSATKTYTLTIYRALSSTITGSTTSYDGTWYGSGSTYNGEISTTTLSATAASPSVQIAYSGSDVNDLDATYYASLRVYTCVARAVNRNTISGDAACTNHAAPTRNSASQGTRTVTLSAAAVGNGGVVVKMWHTGTSDVKAAKWIPISLSNFVDYDTDDDNLIDVRSLGQLNAIRYDLNGDGATASGTDTTNYTAAGAFASRETGMGCASTCTGYELRADLDFDTDGDGIVSASDTGSYTNWDPIGANNNKYTAEFKGNNRTISNLTISSPGSKFRIGLFSNLSSSAVVSGVGMRDVSMTISSLNNASRVGALVGYNEGTIRSSYSTGSMTLTVVSGGQFGGLTGFVEQGGKVEASWSSADVTGTGTNAHVGGLVGQMGFQSNHGSVAASYATGAVSATGTGSRAGGLVGYILTSGSRVTASYSTGTVTASGTNSASHALASAAIGAAYGTLTSNSYWDTTTSSLADDGDSDSPEGQTSSALKSPTGYSGIYSAWNVNVDGSAGNDDPWDFGSSRHYPRLKFDGMDLMAQLGDYDLDDDGLAEIYNLDQLNAVRWDLNGDGAYHSGTSAADQKKFKRAWFNADASLGCPDTADAGTDPGPCTGYELMNDLDFDTNGDGDVDSADAYPTFTPLSPFNSGLPSSGAYTATFNGNNRVISNLTASAGISRVGLFGGLTGTATGVGLSNVNISQDSNSCCGYVGALAAYLHGGGAVRSSWATGSVSSTTTGNTTMYVGGLVGYVLNATVAASWADVAVSAAEGVANAQIRGYSGGLVGNLAGDSTIPGGSIIASYALGSVSSDITATANARSGGLVGNATSSGGSAWTIAASYSAGPVTSTGSAGGLIGVSGGTGTATAAYWDTTTSGIADDNDNNMPEGRTTRQLQQPRPYTGIYSDWNVDVDNADADDSLTTGRDDPWDFGFGMQHPMVKWGGMGLVRQGKLTMGAADVDTNGEAPTVGRMSRVCLTTGPVLRAPRSGSPSLPARWVWQRSSTWSQDDADWTDIAEDGGGTYEYTPVSGDSGRHLRACVDIKSDDARSEGMDRVCTRPFAAVQ